MRIFLFVLCVLFVPTAAFAKNGGMDGGGGQGLLCQLPSGKRSLRSLDLYEAETIWAYEIPKSRSLREEFHRTFPNQQLFLESWVSRVEPPAPMTKEEIDKEFEKLYHGYFESRLRSIPSGTHLKISGDAGSPILQPPSHCKFVQVLFYVDEDFDNGKILVDKEYWDLLSAQDKLAFALHENLYKWNRNYGATDSKSVRKVVGLLFRNAPYPAVIAPTYGKASVRYCYANSTARHEMDIGFYLVPFDGYLEDQKKTFNMTRLVFNSIEEEPLMVETTFDSFWNYDKWMKGEPFETSGVTGWSRSMLGSKRIALGFTDNQCIQKNEKCIPMIEVQGRDGQWRGGEIVCRNIR